MESVSMTIISDGARCFRGKTPWPESGSELYRPNDRRLSTKGEAMGNRSKDATLAYFTLDTKTIFVIPLYLQSVPVHSANCVKTYTVAYNNNNNKNNNNVLLFYYY
jgi:hypothetical protein